MVDAKVIDGGGNHEMGQILNYLKITKLSVELILNFKRSRLKWKRIAL